MYAMNDRAPTTTSVTVTQAAPTTDDAAEVRVCDKQVPILMTTHDQVEYARAEFLVRHFNCAIAQRAVP
jgi:hypothetical protein